MSIVHAAVPPLDVEEQTTVRRVRHQARDAVSVMAFSAATSAGVAAMFLLLAVLTHQA